MEVSEKIHVFKCELTGYSALFKEAALVECYF